MKKYLTMLLLCALPFSLFATPKGWLDDFGEAQKLAAKQKKNMLVFFTGSDWCGLCRALENQVLNQKEFQKTMGREYVFVYVDSPRDKNKISEKNRTENPKLFKKYAIAGTPQILLMTADGGVFGRASYKNTSPKEYAKMLLAQSGASIIPNLRLAIKNVPAGEKRARMIDATLSKVSPELWRANLDLIKEVYAADTTGRLGFRARYFEIVELTPFRSEISAISESLFMASVSARGKSPAETKKILDEAKGKARPRLLEIKTKLNALARENVPATAKKSITTAIGSVDSLLAATK